MKLENTIQGGFQYLYRIYLPYSRFHKVYYNDSNKVNNEINFNAYGFHTCILSKYSPVSCHSSMIWRKVNGMEENINDK